MIQMNVQGHPFDLWIGTQHPGEGRWRCPRYACLGERIHSLVFPIATSPEIQNGSRISCGKVVSWNVVTLFSNDNNLYDQRAMYLLAHVTTTQGQKMSQKQFSQGRKNPQWRTPNLAKPIEMPIFEQCFGFCAANFCKPAEQEPKQLWYWPQHQMSWIPLYVKMAPSV